MNVPLWSLRFLPLVLLVLTSLPLERLHVFRVMLDLLVPVLLPPLAVLELFPFWDPRVVVSVLLVMSVVMVQ